MNRTGYSGLHLIVCGITLAAMASICGAFADPAPADSPPAPPAVKDPAPKPPVAPKPPAKGGKTATELPTMAEIQKSFDVKDYEQTLQLLSKVLPLKGKVAADYDRYKLLMLKANSHLKLRAASPATAALGDAVDATDDPKDKAIARATQTLIKRSKGLIYAAKSKKAKSPAIDITDPEKRQEALEAMWLDDLARVEPKVKAAADGKTLPPIAEALEEMKPLRDEELGATGSNDKSKALANQLSDRAFSLMDKSVKRMTKRVDEIAKAADITERVRVKVPTPAGFNYVEKDRRRGLKATDSQELRDAIAEAPPIGKAAEELGKLIDSKDKSDAIVDATKDIVDNAKRALERG